jgi:adenylylsulfate kinase
MSPEMMGRGANAAGFILWLTGLSGAGKSTLARCVYQRLVQHRSAEILDGDEVRRYLCRDLGFSREDREANVLRIGYLARLLARHGVAVIVAAISPFSESRDEVRRLATAEAIPFLEVFVHADLHGLIARDVKGLYRKALAGHIANFTGVSSPYERPARPDAIVCTDKEPIDRCEAGIIALLRARRLLARSSGVESLSNDAETRQTITNRNRSFRT